nr:MAG TPA: hypothetical protein [Caudoviricetes sp.]
MFYWFLLLFQAVLSPAPGLQLRPLILFLQFMTLSLLLPRRNAPVSLGCH